MLQPEKDENTFKKAMDGLKAPFQAHKGAPGPVVPDNMANIQQEGTKEERQARAAELNK